MSSTQSIKSVFRLLSFTILMTAMGCASGPSANYDASTNPDEAIRKLEQDVNAGVLANYDVMDQKDFVTAQTELSEAKRQQADGDKQEKILSSLGKARGALNQAKAKTEQLQSRAQGILEARTAAVNAGIRNFPAEESRLKDADDDLRSRVSKMEEGKLDAADWSKLQTSYQDLELRAIQSTKLGNARAKIEGARKDGAEKNAPKTMKQAEFNLQNAENIIATDRHNDEKSAPAVEKVNQSAQFLAEVLAQTKQPDGRIGEPVAINLVNQSRKIGQLNQQASEDSSTISGQDQQIARQGKTISAQGETLSLDQALNAARKEFTKQEADVYRQGNKLLIRLKNVNFASGRSDLPATSLAVLSKVGQIAQELKSHQMVVEGHTDSVGTAEKNQSLSQSRADAVATYFASNGFERGEVEAIGYGFSKPLATNKTKAGRATNRRVDVIITPMVADHKSI